MRCLIISGILPGILVLCLTDPVTGALPKEVRKQLAQMSKEARGVGALVRRRKVDEAKELISRLEQQAEELGIDEGERDRTWRTFQRNLERARSQIPASFESEVAPILAARCVRCHGSERASAQLRLDTFDGLRQGGRSGPLLRPGLPQNSLIMARLTAESDRQRMPRNGDPLSDTELGIIARWIGGGARFDGTNPSAPIGSSAKPAPEKKAAVKVVMADGSETISFKDDVAPIFVNFCLRCHRGDEPAGGFSVVTIEDVLRGGDTGDTIIPGNSDDSYLWHLVGLQDPIKMPQGQALLKRSQAMAIKRWIDEGAHFDGKSVQATLRSLVPTEAQRASQQLATMSDTEFADRRIDQATDMWKRAVPRQEFKSVMTDHFLVCGNVDQARLDEFAQLAETQASRLQADFNDESDEGELWRGRLIIFVVGDRFDYTEFNTVLRDRRTPATTHGHVSITAQLSDAWIALHDRDLPASTTELTSDQLLQALVAEAWLIRDGATLPDWLRQGFGLLQADTDRRFLAQLQPQAKQAVRSVSRPADIFRDGTFSPDSVAAVGAMLVQFLQTQGKAKFLTLQQELRSADNPADAVTRSYGQPAEAIARAFLARLRR